MRYFIIAFLFLLNVNKAIALDKSISINSDSFEIQAKNSIMTFYKNVVIDYTDFSGKCDKAIVYIENKTGKVKKIYLSGNVKVKKEKSEISGDKVTFDIESDKIVVEGNVKTKINLLK